MAQKALQYWEKIYIFMIEQILKKYSWLKIVNAWKPRKNSEN